MQGNCGGVACRRSREKQENSGITLLTVHAAKGLEFDHVWIPDCNEKTFPPRKLPGAGAL